MPDTHFQDCPASRWARDPGPCDCHDVIVRGPEAALSDPCPDCEGSGGDHHHAAGPCPTCDGSGWIPQASPFGYAVRRGSAWLKLPRFENRRVVVWIADPLQADRWQFASLATAEALSAGLDPADGWVVVPAPKQWL